MFQQPCSSNNKPCGHTPYEHPFRVVNVSYLNSVPYSTLALCTEVIYSEASPAKCAQMLHERDCDMACIPLMELVSHGGYEVFNAGIVSSGPVDSVLVFANSPLSELKTILVNTETQSSLTLLKILLASLYPDKHQNIKISRIELDNPLSYLDTQTGVLLIGDKALKTRGKSTFEFDLAQMWYQLTSTPMVFGIWAVRPEHLTTSRIETLTSLLKSGIDNKESLALSWADSHKFDKDIAREYVQNRIQYTLDTLSWQGAEQFIRRGTSLGLMPHNALTQFQNTVVHNITRGAAIKQLHLNDKTSYALKNTEEYDNEISYNHIDQLLMVGSDAKRLCIAEGVELARKAPLAELMLAADSAKTVHNNSKKVSYIVSRNINYSNICNVYCRFCAFHKPPGRGGYVLTKYEISQKIEEALELGAVETLLQGGLNPLLSIEYFEDLFSWIRKHYPINLHALSADEILHISHISNISLTETLVRLKKVGLCSIPGGGAEILIDSVRHQVSPKKCSAKEWLEVHRRAHQLGLPSTATMMFGIQETWEDRINHLYKIRQLQDETNGFTAFIAWPYQKGDRKLDSGDVSPTEYLRVLAISRIMLDNIPNIQCSWVTQGPDIGQVALFAGANDFGSVMIEENVVSAAGTSFRMTAKEIENRIREAGFEPFQRTTREFTSTTNKIMG